VNADGLDRRLTVLLDADRRELPFRLRQAVRMLGQKDVRVDWRRLLRDLERWNWPSRPVQKQWARSYFGMQHDLEDPAATDAAPLVGDRPAEETRHVD
jgi:CRISPR system Cascade subunit CasB